MVVGCKLGEIATKRFSLMPEGTTVIHLEAVPEEIGRTTSGTLPLCADAREGILDLGDALASGAEAARVARAPWAAEVAKRMAAWRADVEPRLTSNEVPVNMARMLHELNARLPEDALLVADGGFAAHWGGLLYDTKRPGRGFVPDRGFASIGYGLPGSMGARLGGGCAGDWHHRRRIQYAAELETARRMGLGLPYRKQRCFRLR